MKKFKFTLLILLFIVFVPTVAYAEETEDCDGCVLESETIKYFKTETYYDDLVNTERIIKALSGNAYSVTTEITEEEYEAVDTNVSNIVQTRVGTTIETTYKKMITQIYANGSTYRYKNKLLWKLIPSVRIYDIIGIGFYASVRPSGTPSFSQYYCNPSGCTTSTSRTTQIFSNGTSATFKLPSGTLSALDQTFYFDVAKTNPNSTIISQLAAGDYAHATTSTTLSNALNHQVIQTSGIVLDSSIVGNYDTISQAIVYWSGTW